MARIDADELLSNKEFDEPIRDIPRRRRRRRRRRGRGCCLFIIVILFCLSIACAVVAKTGIVTIPVFSNLFYRLPVPERIVQVAPDASLDLTVTPNLVNRTAKVIITEAQLTLALRQNLSSIDALATQTMQALIEPDGVELFALVLKPVRANITVLLEPTVRDGRLAVAIKEVRIGNLPIPLSLAQRLAHWLFGDMLDRTAQSLQNFAVSEIELSKGSATVVIPIDALLAPSESAAPFLQ